jgi:hypothetical protein
MLDRLLNSTLSLLGGAAAVVILLALAYLAWGLISGVYLTVFDKRLPHTDDEWAALFQRSPRTAALVGLAKTAGWNLPGIVRALKAFFGGGFPPAIKALILGRGLGSSGDVKETVRVVGVELERQVVTTIKAGAKDPPPDPPASPPEAA